MKPVRIIAFAVILFSLSVWAEARVSFTIGTDDFYVSVGDYDYLPYAFVSSPEYVAPRISFHDALTDYGYWAQFQPFGSVWVPYASYGWRPYTQGRWIWTTHGWYWQAYEPWGWLAYHYGHWIWNARFGWVWLPDYEWHAGRVMWAQGYNTIGWMPAPPRGYDYSRGYLAYMGDYNQFSYYDEDFGNYDDGDYSYGGPYYDPRYRDLYYNSNYQQIGINLWIFIGNDHFGYDNYADYYLDPDYTRYVFDRRVVRVSSRPVERVVIERAVKQRILEVPVAEKEIETDRKRVKVIVPLGDEEEKVRKNANRVVKEVIAPAFVEKQRTFKGERSKNKALVAKIFKQENKAPKVETVNSEVILRRAAEVKKVREVKRTQEAQIKKQETETIEKEGKVRQPRKVREASPGTPAESKKNDPFHQERPRKEFNEKPAREAKQPVESSPTEPYDREKPERRKPQIEPENPESPYKPQRKLKEENPRIEQEESTEEVSKQESAEEDQEKSTKKKKTDTKKKPKQTEEKSKKNKEKSKER